MLIKLTSTPTASSAVKERSRRAVNGFSCSQGSRCLIWCRQLEFCASALLGSWGWLQKSFTELPFYCKFPALRGREELLASSTAASGIKTLSRRRCAVSRAQLPRGVRLCPFPPLEQSWGGALGAPHRQHPEAGCCLTHSAGFHFFLVLDFPKRRMFVRSCLSSGETPCL